MLPDIQTITALIDALGLDGDTPIQIQPETGEPFFIDLDDLLADPDLLSQSGILDDLDLSTALPGQSVIRTVVDLKYPDGDTPLIIDLNALFVEYSQFVDQLEDYLALPIEDQDPLDPIFGFLGGVATTGLPGDVDDMMVGTIFEDALSGLAGDDTISGLNWADVLKGNGGNDMISGGNGDDVIRGGSGRDRLFGDEGDDTMSGNGAGDRMFGGIGDDAMNGGNGNDRLKGGTGDDDLTGGNGNDRLWGQAGGDMLGGGAGNDRLRGGADDDEIEGGTGDDRVWGGAGDDTITLSDGADMVYGGDGEDTFIFAAGATGVDEIWADADDAFEVTGFTGQVMINVAQAAGQETVNLLLNGDLVAIVHTDGTPQDVIDLFGL